MRTKEDVINTCLARLRGETYLEIGVRTGDSFVQVRAKRRWGVDPNTMLSTNRVKNALKRQLAVLSGARFFDMTSDAFFETQRPRLTRHGIDAALIDGLHTYEQSLRDVEHCLRYLKPGGVLVLHDCNPSTPAMACPAASAKEAAAKQLPGWTGEWCGDVWKTIVHLRSLTSDLLVCVLDCDYGVGLVKRARPHAPLALSPDAVDAMSYEDLVAQRTRLLNLKPPDYLDEFLSAS